MALKVCAEPGCHVLGSKPRCQEHTRAKDRARGTSAERGYGAKHRRLSERERENAIGETCHFCGEPMLEGQALALDHTEDRTGYRGVAHLSCNAADGGRRRPKS